MKKIIPLIIIGTILASFISAQTTMELNTDSVKQKINKNIYGHFSVHLGRCIYDGFYVGDSNKTIPNTEGVRNDVIAVLRKMKIHLLSWPGGCLVDIYHWKDGVRTKAKRPDMVNNWGGGFR